jgi:hypothetical protein
MQMHEVGATPRSGYLRMTRTGAPSGCTAWIRSPSEAGGTACQKPYFLVLWSSARATRVLAVDPCARAFSRRKACSLVLTIVHLSIGVQR